MRTTGSSLLWQEYLVHSIGGIAYGHYAQSRSVGIQGDHDASPAVSILVPRQGLRWRVSLLPSTIRRRAGATGDVTDAQQPTLCGGDLGSEKRSFVGVRRKRLRLRE